MTQHSQTDIRDGHRWFVFFLISCVYFFVYFHRVSTSVIASDILQAFHANATALGFMSSMYFYLYAFEQPLVGYFTDRLGAGRVISYFTLIAAAGCFVFALAPDIIWASAGRALIGIGVGGVYIPALKAFSQWFKGNEFATMIGLLLAVGNFGAIIATTPLAWAAGIWGWRVSFGAIGIISLALALAVLFSIRDAGSGTGRDPGSQQGQTGSVAGMPVYGPLLSTQFWVIALIFFGVYGIVMTFQGLWATPFLMAALKVDRMGASELNMLIPIGFIFGSPFFGWLADRIFHNKVRIIIFLTGTLSVSWAGIVFGMGWGGWLVSSVLFLMGMATGGIISLVWAHVRDITPARFLGTYSGLLNPAPFFGVAVFQVWTGLLLDQATPVSGAYLPAAYRGSFLFCFIVSCACFLLSWFIKKKVQEA